MFTAMERRGILRMQIRGCVCILPFQDFPPIEATGYMRCSNDPSWAVDGFNLQSRPNTLSVFTANIVFMQEDLLMPIRCTSFKTKQLARVVGRIYDAELTLVGLKSTQFSLLAKVANRGPIGVGALAKVMGLYQFAFNRVNR